VTDFHFLARVVVKIPKSSQITPALKDQMQLFLFVKVNCSSSVFNYNQTHLNIEKGQK